MASPGRKRVFTRWLFTRADIGYGHVLICPECITPEEEERERARKRAWREDTGQHDDE